jgi:hypothetical protein
MTAKLQQELLDATAFFHFFLHAADVDANKNYNANTSGETEQ